MLQGQVQSGLGYMKNTTKAVNLANNFTNMNLHLNQLDFSLTFNQLYEVWRSTKALMLTALFAAHSKLTGDALKSVLWSYRTFELTPENIMLKGYFQGVVPLPNVSHNQRIEWHDPEFRGLIPITGFKAHKDLIRLLKKNLTTTSTERFEVKINHNFKKTIECCAMPRKKTSRTWLSKEYINAAVELHELGIAHSIETYQNGVLVGGVIGYAVNSYFADITLFHTVDNASKVGYYYLLHKLRDEGFTLHDSGFGQNWFHQFGAVDTPRAEFKRQLAKSIIMPTKFTENVPELNGASIKHSKFGNKAPAPVF